MFRFMYLYKRHVLLGETKQTTVGQQKSKPGAKLGRMVNTKRVYLDKQTIICINRGICMSELATLRLP